MSVPSYSTVYVRCCYPVLYVVTRIVCDVLVQFSVPQPSVLSFNLVILCRHLDYRVTLVGDF